MTRGILEFFKVRFRFRWRRSRSIVRHLELSTMLGQSITNLIDTCHMYISTCKILVFYVIGRHLLLIREECVIFENVPDFLVQTLAFDSAGLAGPSMN